jgi:hypothetical protein
MGASSGIWFEQNTEGDTDVWGIVTGDYSSFDNINMSGIKSFTTRIASSAYAGTIQLHLDSPTGSLLGICAVPITYGAQFWATVSCNLAPVAGNHTLYLVYQSYTNAIVFSHSWFALDDTIVSPQAGSNLTVLASNNLTAVNLGGQACGQAIYGGEYVTNNAPLAGFTVGSNSVVWVSTNLSGNSVPTAQTVVVVPFADAPGSLTAIPGDGQVALSWNAATNAYLYNVKEANSGNGPFTGVASAVSETNYVVTNLSNGSSYFFVVCSTNALSESVESGPVTALPTSSMSPLLTLEAVAGGVQLRWPSDHIGWILLAQTNGFGAGLGTNWMPVAGTSNLNQWAQPFYSTNGSVFYRLRYPY